MSKTPSTPAPWIAERSDYDATRPWAVRATFRSFNRTKARYTDEDKAKRRARDLNRKFYAEH